ncbi:MAG: acylphosphatase [Candidatus Diapherotrites archaeon]
MQIMKTVHLLISGKVQGVFFRAFTKDNARQLNLKGWARNLTNGKVEVLASGNVKDLNELIHRLKEGTPASDVDDVEIKWLSFDDSLSVFDIYKTKETEN